MKYIDAEKLIAEIRRIVKEETPISKGSDYYHGVADTAGKLLCFIDSLQQEQPESGSSEKPNSLLSEKQEQSGVDLEKEMENDYDSPLWDGETVSWMTYTRIAHHFYEFGLNARKDKLPEIELDKFTEKIKTFQGRYKHPEIVSIKGAMAFMARMFYQYPNTARLWYEQLPKATMDDARKDE